MSESWGMWVTVAVIAIAAVMWWRANSGPSSDPNGPPQPNTRIHGQQARKLVQEGALLVDVRSPGEFAGGHIDGAINIPLNTLGSRMGELGASDKAIVLYCRSGARSRSAMGNITGKGFTQVYDLGPIGAW